jgi:hypothetical protein
MCLAFLVTAPAAVALAKETSSQQPAPAKRAPAMASTAAVAKQRPVAEPKITKEGAAFFENKIRPLLVHHCYECHSGDPAKAKGHLVVDTHDGLRKGGDSGAAVLPKHVDTSLLMEAIRYEGLQMPPKGQLPEEAIADFAAWIEMGAPDPRVGKAANPKNKVDLAEARRYWAFQPPKAKRPPNVKDAGWPRTDIDRFVRARQEQEQLTPAPDADRTTLLRRVSFDLVGLPPTPAEIDAFLNDKSSQAMEKVVDRLLASPQFGERWGRHWLDVARFGESTGKDRNLPYRYAWRYRNYVIDAFNEGKPYDKFIVEQLAGDLLPSKDPAERDRLSVATGFLAIGPSAVNTKQEQFVMDQIDDQIDVTSRAFLGMTVACARCHDHKFDPIPTSDYYALAGIFHSTKTYSGVVNQRKTAMDEDLLKLTSVDKRPKLSPDELKAEHQRLQEIAKIDAQIAELRRPAKRPQMQAAAQPQLGKKGGKGTEVMANPLAAATPPVGKQRRDEIKELQDKRDDLAGIPLKSVELAMGVRDEATPSNCNVLLRGEVNNKGPETPRGVLTVLKTSQSQIDPKHSGRLELARWIASKDNPLTARVMVNRVWEHLMGQGLVDTVDNFGALGNEPSNPELLDAMAVQFMEQNWSIKRLIRSIVLSRVYQLGSKYDATADEKDPDNKLLWRHSPRRLDAEEIRDAMLATSGQLKLERPEGSKMLEMSNKQVGGMKLGADNDARSVYLPIPRNHTPETLKVFDMADPNLILGKRDVTTVPTQALYLLNNPFVLKSAEQMGKRLLAEDKLSNDARIDLAYRLALGRLPTPDEKYTVERYLQEYRQAVDAAGKKANSATAAWASFCQTLFALGEFRYVY